MRIPSPDTSSKAELFAREQNDQESQYDPDELNEFRRGAPLANLGSHMVDKIQRLAARIDTRGAKVAVAACPCCSANTANLAWLPRGLGVAFFEKIKATATSNGLQFTNEEGDSNTDVCSNQTRICEFSTPLNTTNEEDVISQSHLVQQVPVPAVA